MLHKGIWLSRVGNAGELIPKALCRPWQALRRVLEPPLLQEGRMRRAVAVLSSESVR
jgi:hypothetical protein